MKEVSSPQWKSIFINATKISFCLWYNSLLVKWFTSVEVEIWTKDFTKKCLYVQILKTFECRFFYITRRIFGNRQLIWVIQQNVITTLKIFVAKRTLYRFHTFTGLFYLTCQVFQLYLYLVIAWQKHILKPKLLGQTEN